LLTSLSDFIIATAAKCAIVRIGMRSADKLDSVIAVIMFAVPLSDSNALLHVAW
jgi:hypothetical protein